MKNERMFLRCNICGNIVGMVKDSGVTPVCCGEEMKLLKPNTTDAAQEKHVPVGSRGNGVVTVKIGSAPHPMVEEHHIAWVAIAYSNCTQRMTLDKIGIPEAVFSVKEEDPITMYAYCNLHGLWAAEIG